MSESSRDLSESLQMRKNATTLVIKNPRANKSQFTKKTAQTKAIVALVPKRSQRSMLHQVDHGTGPELKNIDVDTTFAPPLVTAFASPQLLNGVAEGTSASTRIGRRILMKSFQYRAILDQTEGSNVSQHRILVVYDKQPNGVAPIMGDILQFNGFLSPLRLVNSDRFVVIIDEITEMAPTSNLNVSSHRYRKVNLETIFSGTGGAVANMNSGAVWMSIANNSDPTIGTVTGAFVSTRIRYIDN